MSKRDDYVNNLKSQLDQWNAEITKWEGQAKAAQANLRAEYEKQLAGFRARRDQATEQLRKIQAATGDAWIDLARGADQAWASMSEAFEKARSHFKK
ncbi:MAG TPA: hypothetical protein VEF92_03110 [Burkholderiales bacterium]|nr:hypothetical protein [Burkholderiales bacterium]